MKKAVSLLITVILLCTSVISFGAQEDIILKSNNTAQFFSESCEPGTGSIGGEWLVLGLARGGYLSEGFRLGYYEHAVRYVGSVGSSKLHRSKVTDNARMILALTAVGEDPHSVAGFDLLEPLADFNYVKKQGLNGVVWTLTALDSMQYEIPENSSAKIRTTRELLISEILEKQLADGGWSLDGDCADTDMTGMTLQALAPYRKTDSKVNEAVDRALNMLSEMQDGSGGFALDSAITPEGCAQILTAFSALEIDAQADSRFIKQGSVIDCMLGFSAENAFAHTKGGGYNQMASEQCLYALVSYIRFKNGQTPLYDMTDLHQRGDVNGDGVTTIDDVTEIQKYLARLKTFSLLQKKLADSDSSGEITIDDATMLQKYLAFMV